MAKNIQLKIDRPCGESWEKMEAGYEGRFCQACQKTVVDVTGMSDREVMAWLASAKGGVCGRLYAGQLNRAMEGADAVGMGGLSGGAGVGLRTSAGIAGGLRRAAGGGFGANEVSESVVDGSGRGAVGVAGDGFGFPGVSGEVFPGRKRGWIGFWKFLLAGLLVSAEASAQEIKDSVKTEQVVGVDRSEVVMGKMAFAPDTMSGKVVDSATGKPLENVTVMYDKKHGVVTDSKGRFKIVRMDGEGINELHIMAVGYYEKTIRIDENWRRRKKKVIELNMSEVVLTGEVAIVRDDE